MTYIETIDQNGFATMIFADAKKQKYVINLFVALRGVEADDVRGIQASNNYSNPYGRQKLTNETLNELATSATAYIQAHPELVAEWEAKTKA